MAENAREPRYDLEDRTFLFAKTSPDVCEDVAADDLQSGRCAASCAGFRFLCRKTYIEANEALSKKDFQMRINTCRKESKECRYWLRLLDTQEVSGLAAERDRLIQESTELMRILAAILAKVGRMTF